MAKLNYHIVRTYEVGNIVHDGILKVRQYENICRNHPEPARMENKINKDGSTTEAYVECPTCNIKILEGYYED